MAIFVLVFDRVCQCVFKCDQVCPYATLAAGGIIYSLNGILFSVVIWKYEQLKKPSDHFFEKIIFKKVVL